MRKVAIFVEGQTELIIVRELILKVFNYSNVWVECYTLFTDHKFISTEYSFPNEGAEYYYQIINVGNDQGVITRMRNRADYMWAQGFIKMVGLRDMYSKEYREAAGTGNIDLEILQQFIDGHNSAKPLGDVSFCFAIMEVEAWILGMPELLQKIHPDLQPEFIQLELNINLIEVDPESSFYHPAQTLTSILRLVGLSYDKKKGEVNSFMGLAEREHLIELNLSAKCSSFTNFCHACTFPENLYFQL